MMTELGLDKYVALYAVRGRSCPAQGRALTAWVIRQIGMDAAGLEPQVWLYPVAVDGELRGGVGHTLVQPITESVMYQDYWAEHEGYYLLVASCARFSAPRLALRLRYHLRRLGHRLLRYDTCRTSLRPAAPGWRFWRRW